MVHFAGKQAQQKRRALPPCVGYSGWAGGLIQQQAHGQAKAVPETGEPLFIGPLALQIVQSVQEIQAQLGMDLIVTGIQAAQPFLRAGEAAGLVDRVRDAAAPSGA